MRKTSCGATNGYLSFPSFLLSLSIKPKLSCVIAIRDYDAPNCPICSTFRLTGYLLTAMATRLAVATWVSRDGSVWLRRRRILEKMPSARGRDREEGALASFFMARHTAAHGDRLWSSGRSPLTQGVKGRHTSNSTRWPDSLVRGSAALRRSTAQHHVSEDAGQSPWYTGRRTRFHNPL